MKTTQVGRIIAIIALVAIVVSLIAPAIVGAQESSIDVTLAFREPVELTPDAVISVQLLDVSQTGVPAQVLSEQRVTVGGLQAPYRFNLPYDPATVRPEAIYSVQANILADGQVRYLTTTLNRVLSGGAGTQITVTLSPIGLPAASNGNWPLLASFGLAGLILLARLARRTIAPRTIGAESLS